MVTREENDLLTRAGPGTPMGTLMRRYWIPAAMSSEVVADGAPLRLMLLGEQLLAFRDSEGRVGDYGVGEAWYESGPDPVHATAATDRPSAFVRVLVLPSAWEGKRTIRYVDPADEDKPKLQKPTVFFDRAIELPR